MAAGFMGGGGGGLSTSSTATSGAHEESSSTMVAASPWYEGDIVLATGNSTASGSSHTMPADSSTLGGAAAITAQYPSLPGAIAFPSYSPAAGLGVYAQASGAASGISGNTLLLLGAAAAVGLVLWRR